MIDVLDLTKAIDIIEKWCLDNGFTENKTYMYKDNPEYHRLDGDAPSIQLHFRNDEGILYDVTINNGVGFNIEKREFGKGKNEYGQEVEQEWLYQYSPINELNIDSFIVIQSWFIQNSNFTKFPDIRQIIVYGEE